MKKTLNRTLAMLLTLALLLGITPLAEFGMFTLEASAESHTGFCNDSSTVSWSFDPEAGALSISGEGATADWADSSEVPWKDYLINIENVTIASGVTGIGSRAFWGCTALTEVTIPVSVASIGDYAFNNCTSLITVTYAGTQAQRESMTIGALGNSALIDLTWSEVSNEYTITWVPFVGEETQQTVTKGDTIERTIEQSVVTGYEFVRWQWKNSDTDTLITGDLNGTEMPSYNLTATEIQEPKTYTITWIEHGGNETSSNFKYGDTIVSSVELEPVTGYDVSWTWINADTEEPITGNLVGTEMPAYNLTASEKRQPHLYTITWEKWGVYTSQTVSYGSIITCPIDPSIIGKNFIGWQWKYKGTPLLSQNDLVGTPMPASDMLAFAKYVTASYTITFDTDGGTPIDSIQRSYSSSISLPTNPTKGKYTFAGWVWTYVDENGDTQTLDETPTRMPAHDLTATAQWADIKYSITWKYGDTEDTDELDLNSTIVPPAAADKAGFDTIWTYTYLDKDGNTQTLTQAPTTMPDYSLTATASYTVKIRSATFVTDVGSFSESGTNYVSNKEYVFTAAYGTVIQEPVVPVCIGCDFKGWRLSGSDGEYFAAGSTIQEENIKYKARWEVSEIALTFDANGGSFSDETSTANITRNYDTSLEAPEIPTRYGFTFIGWSPTVPAKVPATDTTYIALWERTPYTVTFNTDGGSAIEPLAVRYNAEIKMPEDPQKTGYSFDGWVWTYVDGHGDTRTLEDGKPALMPAHALTATAQWKICSYTLTWYVDEDDQSSFTYEYGAVIERKEPPKKDGSEFLGWEPEIPATMPASDIKISAVFSTNEYTVTYIIPDASNQTETYAYGDVIPVRTDLNKVGHETQWVWSYVDATGETNTLESKPEKMPAYNLTATVTYVLRSYTVQFSTNSFGIFDLTAVEENIDRYTPDDPFFSRNYIYSAEYGSVIECPIDPVMDGHRFIGWDGYIANATVSDKNVTYIAEWEIISTTQTFNTDGGVYEIFGTEGCPEAYTSASTYSVTAEYNSALTAPQDPVREGYVFEGWSQVIPEKFPGKDTVYTAVWSKNQYTIKFVTSGGTVIPDIRQEVDTPIDVVIDNPTRDGYTFDGWDVEIPETMPVGGLTITAQWKALDFTVTWVAEGSTIPDSTFPCGEAIVLPDEPAKIGYTFVRWVFSYTDADNATHTLEATPEVMPAYNLTATAEYIERLYVITFVTGEGGTVIEPIIDYRGTAIPSVPDPVRTGYTFDGWDIEIPVTMPTNDLTVTAIWTGLPFTVTWSADGSEIPDSTVNCGDAITEPEDPEKEGYSFAGWSYFNAEDPDNLIPLDAKPEAMPAYKLTAVAQWQIKRFTVFFSTGAAGVVVPPIMQDYNTAITAPASPTRVGYEFAGWSPEIPAVMPAHNVALTAQWTAKEYTITFDSNGGTAVAPITQLFDSALTAPEAPTKQGYVFDHWSPAFPETMPLSTTYTAVWAAGVSNYTVETYLMKPDGSFAEKPDSDTIKSGTTDATITESAATIDGYSFNNAASFATCVVAADGTSVVKLYYDANFYEARFYSDGAIVDIKNVRYGAQITAPTTDLKKTAFIFKGWDNDVTATEPLESLGTMDSTGGKKFYAVWANGRFTVTYYKSGANGVPDVTSKHATQIYIYGDSIALPSEPLSPDVGEVYFGGWNWFKADGTAIESPQKMPEGDLIAIATWPAVTKYALTFDLNGGTYNDSTDNVVQNYAQNMSFSLLTGISREGYTQNGWLYKRTDTGIAISKPTSMPAYGVTAIAQWTANRYTLTFDTVGGSTLPPITQNYGTAISLSIVPVKVGYTFAGWEPELPQFMPAESKTLTAKWTVNQYKIIFDTAGGSLIDPISVNYGAALVMPVNPTRIGYTFAGWSNSVPATMPANNLSFTALWTINTYTITWVVDGTKATASYKYGERIIAPANPVLSGYTFTGWDIEVPTTMPANDLEITATFKNAPKISIKNNPKTTTLDYGEYLILTAEYEGLPTGAVVQWYVNGVVSGSGDTFEFGKATEDATVTVKAVYPSGQTVLMDDGTEVSDSETINVNGGFFKILASFFKNIFGVIRKRSQSVFGFYN